ncbi:MAG: hypothetical protein Unbinned3891contig1000_58 [Prokaryotic dsDNA virus sp.]|nr:MAG: hypothetical protein Unbinned3891contig1000_58 [Prokaryotic dsDNA virus sp.]|tara:strand:- start:60601 stop:61242 length:642 start_codon:yes stop_codon:yes gene_type:complete
MNVCITTHTGKQFDLQDPNPALVDIEDIAWALSNLCRFVGHTPTFYSVAEHSALVASVLLEKTRDPVWAMAGLLHDAHEAYMGDIPQPLKNLIGLEHINVIAGRLDMAVVKGLDILPNRSGLPIILSQMWSREMQQADLWTFYWERYHFMNGPRPGSMLDPMREIKQEAEPAPESKRSDLVDMDGWIHALNPEAAMKHFMRSYQTLLTQIRNK